MESNDILNKPPRETENYPRNDRGGQYITYYSKI